jgi:hypothetical protein
MRHPPGESTLKQCDHKFYFSRAIFRFADTANQLTSYFIATLTKKVSAMLRTIFDFIGAVILCGAITLLIFMA